MRSFDAREFGLREEGKDYILRPGVYAIIFATEESPRRLAVINVKGQFFLPGGGVEEGESNSEALSRELREEAGFELQAFQEIGVARRKPLDEKSGQCLAPLLQYPRDCEDHLQGFRSAG